MIDEAVLDALLANGASAEMIVAAVKAAQKPERERLKRQRAKDAERKRLHRIKDPLRIAVFERDGEICAYCGATDGPFHLDHIMPASRGGPTSFGNLTVACETCNCSKHDQTPEEWLS